MAPQSSVRVAALERDARSASVPRADDADERILVARTRAGDAAAFGSIFETYCEPLCVFVARYLGSQEAAEDVVQALFCRLWEQRATWEPAAGVRAYLFGAARNRALNARRDARGNGVEMTLTLAAPGGSDELTFASDLTRAVDQAVAVLPPRCREVFRMRRDAGLSYAEIAAAMGISVKTVGVHMGRAIAVLRRHLAPWTNQAG